LARGDVLLLYFSLPSLKKKFHYQNKHFSLKIQLKSNLYYIYLNLTNGSSPLSAAGRPFASTSKIVTTELQICDLSFLDASTNFGFRWKY
jgi:hypothetical protein